ncbi:hypothetical protein HZI73_20760 [Vallitalea pronyensis]|uniref:DNA mismatch repair proteins mutS family domain-containing protein n=1 Tax=Vallitalea pronyensis TaxID=1348613 RepID=A0A8J8SIL8_9FIRM|nr:hypothetical protein [Vallitalea pronyensis]QUI24584.1 hypothetical protein HZI73_20760 [Vallitalea pronyensis]
MFDSLLWLPESQYKKIHPQVIEDLNLHRLYDRLMDISEENEALIYKICMDEETIRYRQAILTDFMDSPDFIKDLEMNLKEFYDLQSRNSKVTETHSNFYYLIDLVMTVDMSIRCAENLRQTLLYHQPTSQGLLGLLENVEHLIQEKEFKAMKQDLKNIQHIFRQIRGLEVSINMSPVMRAYEAQVTHITDHTFRYPGVFRKVATMSDSGLQFMGRYLKRYDAVFNMGKVHLDLMDEMEYGLREHRDILLEFLERYRKLDTKPFVSLLQEVTFYKASCDLLNTLRNQNLPICKPQILDASKRTMRLKDCYNIALAIHDQERSEETEAIIYNNMNMDEDGRIIILTGANRGGKTTITQAIGQIQIFGQLGLLVPAQEADLSLVDGVFTHFPVLEKETVHLGRFGKECEGFNRIFKLATSKSLLLLNESFSGTSYLESLKIAEEVVKAVKYKRMRMIYNTHLHELATHTRILNKELNNDTPIVSLVTGFQNGHNTYKIYQGNPLGMSHGIEIAKQHKVTYHQLIRRLEEKA